MDNYNQTVTEIKTDFAKHNNRILRLVKTKKPAIRTQYLKEAIASYNRFITEVNTLFI